jgi:hypothetical protein
LDRASRAYQAFRAPEAPPVKDAVKLRSMPTGALASEIRRSKRKKPFVRPPVDYRRYLPTDIEAALDMANGSGVLGGVTGVATIAAWVRANPVVYGVTKGRTSVPWRPVGVKHSDEAAAWLEGTPERRGWRKRICDPAELENMASNRFHSGYCIGVNVWNEELGHPEFQSLDPAGVRYLRGEDRYQYYGWSKVFDLPRTPDGIWVFDGLTKNAPWREGAWYRIAYDNHGALNAMLLEDLWMQVFAMPTVLAYHPQGASETQKARFTQKAIGAALKVLGVTAGYKLEFAQARAEGKDTFAQAVNRLRENVSILTWGTLGLISGGSGFANADLFEQMKADVIAEEAERQARMENEQIWPFVLDWGVRCGELSKAACNAVIEYQTESAAVVKSKAEAAKALIEAGYSAEEAQRRVGLAKSAMPDAAPTSGARVVALPEARAEEPEEPGYSEELAARMTERGLDACPHGEPRSCRSCRVVRRFEVQDGADPYRPVWHAWTRRAA